MSAVNSPSPLSMSSEPSPDFSAMPPVAGADGVEQMPPDFAVEIPLSANAPLPDAEGLVGEEPAPPNRRPKTVQRPAPRQEEPEPAAEPEPEPAAAEAEAEEPAGLDSITLSRAQRAGLDPETAATLAEAGKLDKLLATFDANLIDRAIQGRQQGQQPGQQPAQQAQQQQPPQQPSDPLAAALMRMLAPQQASQPAPAPQAQPQSVEDALVKFADTDWESEQEGYGIDKNIRRNVEKVVASVSKGHNEIRGIVNKVLQEVVVPMYQRMQTLEGAINAQIGGTIEDLFEGQDASWHGIFGKGYSDNLPANSPQRKARQELVGHMMALASADPTLACAILIANNLRDIPTDAASGKRTLAVRLGDARTRKLYTGLLIVPWLAVLSLLFAHPWVVVAGFAAPLSFRPLRAIRGGASGLGLLPVLQDTGRFELVYGILLGLLLALPR
jgi:hypothetical protein